MIDQAYDIVFFDLGSDDEGPLEATLLSSKKNSARTRAVLYLHGYLDYFFHDHLGVFFINNDYDFYALELRRYGRNLQAYQSPNNCNSISEYYQELTMAIKAIKEAGAVDLTFVGHSMGALVGVHYAYDGPMRKSINRMILNAPFFDFQAPKIYKIFFPPLLKLLALFTKKGSFKKGISPLYPMSIHKDYYGEWDFDLRVKPIQGFPVYFQWLLAVHEGMDKVRNQIQLEIPILLLHSNRSIVPKKWNEELKHADAVLNVNDMKNVGQRLGRNVALVEIKRAVHDTFLSNPEVVKKAFSHMKDWLEKFVGDNAKEKNKT